MGEARRLIQVQPESPDIQFFLPFPELQRTGAVSWLLDLYNQVGGKANEQGRDAPWPMLIQALIPLGLEAVTEELQNEVTRLTGDRYTRKEHQNPNRRWGSQQGSVYLRSCFKIIVSPETEVKN